MNSIAIIEARIDRAYREAAVVHDVLNAAKDGIGEKGRRPQSGNY
jgi:hypothetical protein